MNFGEGARKKLSGGPVLGGSSIKGPCSSTSSRFLPSASCMSRAGPMALLVGLSSL